LRPEKPLTFEPVPRGFRLWTFRMYVSIDRLHLCCACLALLESDRVRVT
jgi:hypothetical protein